MKYQSEIVKEIIASKGHSKSLPHYESECIETWIEETKGAYPKLTDYKGEWLAYINDNNGIGEFPYDSLTDVTEATIENVVPYAYKSAILKGDTKYRDIDTGDILDTFDETKNLELVSVKMPVLTTTNADGTKSKILTTPEDLELRGIGGVKDELNLMTGEVVQRVGELLLNGSEGWKAGLWINQVEGIGFEVKIKNDVKPSVFVKAISDKLLYNSSSNFKNDGEYFDMVGAGNGETWVRIRILRSELSTEDAEGFKKWLSQNNVKILYELSDKPIKTVDLTVTDQDGNTESIIRPIEGTMHVSTSSQTLTPLLDMSVPVEATTQNLMSFANIEEGE